VYRGYRFRSRLEARWAVFFDSIGLQFEYEPEGFVLPSGQCYLPDFCVVTPQGKRCWYEVKPITTRVDAKFDEFKFATIDHLFDGDAYPFRGCLLSGDPCDFLTSDNTYRSEYSICPRCGFLGFGLDRDENFAQCEPCDFDTPIGGGHPQEFGVLGISVRPHKGAVIVDSPSDVTYLLSRVSKAAIDARQARFEHGARRAA